MSFVTAFVLCIGFVITKLKIEGQTIIIQKTPPQSYKTQIKIQPYHVLG